MAITSLLTKIAKISNSVLGEQGVFHNAYDNTDTDCNVIIDQSAEVQTEFGAIGGYDIEAILLKSEIASVSRMDLITVGSDIYRINLISRETVGKYYCSVVKVK